MICTKSMLTKKFMGIFVALGFVYSFLVPLVFGILLGVVTILSTSVLFSSRSRFARGELSNIGFIIYLVVLLVLDFIYFIVIQKAELFVSNTVFIDAFFWANPPFVMVDEFLFRGFLWKLLRDFGFTENKIIYTQSFLFWSFHFYLEPIIFWIFLPLISILLGFLTSRAKSITPSIFLHLLHNVFSFIFRY
ncbi:MAG: CPBP family intramembrane metalloprotease [Anaerolineales bacterium]|uniref:CPBP family intramembrane glutamic endopeptidase n=1 Tax=Candidatus Villigracilis proximus TaxID=3140683 RepID=UPI0031358A73|nr:CPBP family intramembrane metalloprotease [Anaerolineales bacterium]